MLFNSLSFAVFFPTVVLLYFLLPQKLRWAMLLVASCLFYMAFIPSYILILAVTIIVDYFCGMFIEDATGRRRRLLLIASIVTNVTFLAIFKYFNFINDNVAGLAKFLHWNYSVPALSIILPIGLSFHTFQAMSYTIEVYRGNQKAERNFGIFSLYVMFFPQLVAGPIERPQNLLHQFRERHVFDYDRVVSGLRLMLWGFFKKIVIADNCAIIVNAVFNNPTPYAGAPLILASLLFAYQIYCDFSGYSDIARGAARVLGYELMLNFDRPYAAKSIPEFWRRWHISLSTWFKDYLYVPLGGNRVPALRRNMNLMIVFLVSGLWHGANWTFIVWGALHGAYIVLSNVTMPVRKPVHAFMDRLKLGFVRRTFAVIITFVLVTFGWIFFRANKLSDAVYIIRNMLYDLPAPMETIMKSITSLGLDAQQLFWLAAAIVFMEAIQLTARWRPADEIFTALRRPGRWAMYYVLLVWILFLGQFGSREFIYFQF